jgi:hypothetical protein
MPSTATFGCAAEKRSSAGISWRQYVHQDAQKLTITGRPRYAVSAIGAPPRRLGTTNAGAGPLPDGRTAAWVDDDMPDVHPASTRAARPVAPMAAKMRRTDVTLPQPTGTMSAEGLNTTLERYDRGLGDAARRRIGARRGLSDALGIAADVMSPAYRVAVLTLILWRPTRARGIRALAAAVAAALIAKRLRDAIARPRPGARTEGGLPSRHAAASVAIAAVVARRRAGVGVVVAFVTALGLLGRVTTGDHDPADVVSGALLGGLVARVVLWATERSRAPEAD